MPAREFAAILPDSRKALGIVADEAGDKVLRSDLVDAEGCCRFQSIPPLEDGDHFQLLLSIVTGVSDHQLCRIFLLDRSAIAAIRHNFQTRIHRHFSGLTNSLRRPPRTVLPQLMGDAD